MMQGSSDVVVSVVIETVTTREHSSAESLVDALQGTLHAVERQTYPRERFEIIVVLDDAIDAGIAAALQRRYPCVTITHAQESNYFDAKNSGARAARGSIVALLDGDCQPRPDWLELLMSRFDPDVGAVVGSTAYVGRSFLARTFSVPDFGNVIERGGLASGIMLNNTAFRREILLSHPLDARIRRNGGCYLLYHQLQSQGVRILFERRARVMHGLDIRGLGFIRKHFDRGYDGVSVYRYDDRGLLRGTTLFRRLGGLALFPITARRIVLDWIRLTRERRQIGLSFFALPYYYAVAFGTRMIELAGSLAALASAH
jgi:glycosyltransferase involved in cell wall biosynthesis